MEIARRKRNGTGGVCTSESVCAQRESGLSGQSRRARLTQQARASPKRNRGRHRRRLCRPRIAQKKWGPAPSQALPRLAQKKWGPALLPAPTAPSEGYAGVRNLVPVTRRPQKPALDPGSPAQASPPIKQLPRERSPTSLLQCAARRFAAVSSRPARR
jgi:hypothetical protein